MDEEHQHTLRRLNAMSEDELNLICSKLRLHIGGKWKNLDSKWGIYPEDVIQQALTDILEGKRKWPPDLAFSIFLRNTVRSIISNELEKAKKRKTDLFASLDDVPAQSAQSPLPDELVIIKQLRAKRLAAVGNSYELVEIMDLLECDFKPKQIAAKLGRPIKYVRAAQKRLKRIIKKLRDGFSPSTE